MPVNLHGKSYNTVAERINSAGKELIGVSTEVLFTDPVVIKATIITNKGTFTGISAANASKTIEKESPFEVAETSAVGRALAFAGYETTNGIASAEEVIKATSGVSNAPKTSDVVKMDEKCPKCGRGLIEKTTKSGKRVITCETQGYSNGQTTGCPFTQWINED
jgi:ssDNA-binding Zn-finger/Zn-ribbon topoisomerase 1